jgi:hypothetical protein
VVLSGNRGAVAKMENSVSVQRPGKFRNLRLRLSLRGFIACVMLIGVGLWATSSSREQRSLVKVIERDGGEIGYDYEPALDHPPGPQWIRDILGDGLFFKPRSVVFMGNFQNPIPDEALHAMAKLNSLVGVEFHMYTIKRDQLKYLLSLKNLETLESDAMFFGDTEIEQFSSLVKLRRLTLRGTMVTARGIAALKALGHIESLDLGSGISKIDDDAVRELSSIPTLEQLCFNARQVSNSGLLQLVSIKGLKELDLDDFSGSGRTLVLLRAGIPGLEIRCSGPFPQEGEHGE